MRLFLVDWNINTAIISATIVQDIVRDSQPFEWSQRSFP